MTNQSVGYGAASDREWSFTWHADYGTLTSVTDPEGRSNTFEYSEALLVKQKLQDGAGGWYETLYGYTTNGLLSAVTNANGHWVRYEYDPYGFPTSTIPQLGPQVDTLYSPLGYCTNISLPGPAGDRVTELDVDELGLVHKVTYPDSLYETMAYDPLGNLTNHVDRAGRTTWFAYLPTRKLASVTRLLGTNRLVTAYTYDQQFNTLSITDPLGRAVEGYALDIERRPVAVTNLEGQTMNVVYGLGSYVKSISRFDGTAVSNAYNSAGLLSAARFPDATNSFTYLANDLLLAAANTEGVVSNAWNGANRLSSQVQTAPDGTVSYLYDAVGNVTGMTSVAGTAAYSYDAAERVSRIEAPDGTFTYGYDPYNALAQAAGLCRAW